MKKIKRILASVLSLSVMMCAAGCGGAEGSNTAFAGDSSAEASAEKSAGTSAKEQPADGKKLSVVCTIFPEYDWVREIAGTTRNVEITCLLDNGVDLHSYQPTADDIVKISTCDLFVYVGGESDEWVADALKEATNKDMKVINLMDVMGGKAKAEELKEGMQEHEHDHEHEEGEEHGHEHEEGEIEYDEHVWLSLKNAGLLCAEIEKDLAAVDPANADSYKANLDAYVAKLDTLDNDFRTLVESAGKTTLIFGDRFPFRYFVDDYGIDYYAAFAGCSAETEASFETITFLSGKAKELGADTIYTIENSDGRIAKSVIDAAGTGNMTTAVFNSVQSVTKEQIESGTTYLSLMQQNYDTLKADIG